MARHIGINQLYACLHHVCMYCCSVFRQVLCGALLGSRDLADTLSIGVKHALYSFVGHTLRSLAAREYSMGYATLKQKILLSRHQFDYTRIKSSRIH